MKTLRDSTFWIGPISAAGEGPLYQQIVEGVRREIGAGRLAPGAELPSFRALAGELLVSLITVKRAYEELERAGIIVRRQGRGTFVAENGADQSRADQERLAAERFGEALRAARQAGLGERAIRAMFREIMNKELGDE